MFAFNSWTDLGTSSVNAIFLYLLELLFVLKIELGWFLFWRIEGILEEPSLDTGRYSYEAIGNLYGFEMADWSGIIFEERLFCVKFEVE
jgi:hypothetical protein